jgi:hypothetical protein
MYGVSSSFFSFSRPHLMMAAIWVRFFYLSFFPPDSFSQLVKFSTELIIIRQKWEMIDFLLTRDDGHAEWCVLVGRRVAADQFDCIWLIYY